MTVTAILAEQAVTTGGSKQASGFRGVGDSTAFPGVPTIGVAEADFTPDLSVEELQYAEGGIRENAGWNFNAYEPVYAGADGFPTTSPTSGVTSYRLLGVALSQTSYLLLTPLLAFSRAAAGQRPMSIGDNNPIPHQAQDAERSSHKDYLGIGGPTAPAPTAHREVTIQYVDDTHVQIKMMGDDGTIRTSASIALS